MGEVVLRLLVKMRLVSEILLISVSFLNMMGKRGRAVEAPSSCSCAVKAGILVECSIQVGEGLFYTVFLQQLWFA